MAESVGEVQLDLVTNQQQFNQQMAGIQNTAKKVGKVLAAAFVVKEIASFTKDCLKLGSDLSEVQNVVDVTFPRMNAQVNKFAQTAAGTFGLSETMAKKYVGTFGAMAKAFGFTESAAYDMATELAGLSGDVASFYNISQDEAYTKLKSVFTGETETLKDLGIVMTQNALDAYAMANGYGKVTSAMTEQEKVGLRCAFVQDQLTLAAGDFARTSGSWANQTRLLSLQFDALKASIGQGLIQVLTPIIQVINIVLSKLSALASSFAKFTASIFGKQDAQSATTGLDSVAESANNASGAVSGVGASAKKAKQDVQKALMGFDKINKLSDSSGSGTGGSGGAGGTGGTSTATPDNETKKSSGLLDQLSSKFAKLKSEFAKGFNLGAGNIKQSVANCKKHLQGIGDSLKDIFTDKNVSAAFKNLVLLLAKNSGMVVGAIASIGMTIAENLLGGFDKYLKQNKERIKKWLVDMFNISGQISTISAKFIAAVANIFSALRTEGAKQLTADLIACITSAAGGAMKLAVKLGRDIMNVLTKPIIDNQDKLKTALENTIKPIGTIINGLKGIIQNTMDKLNDVYDKHFKPLFDSIATGLSEIVGVVTDKYNKYISPVIQKLASKTKTLMSQYIQPMINKAIELLGDIADVIKVLWNKVLKPIVKWLAANIIPVVAKVINVVGTVVIGFAKVVSKVVTGILTALRGIITFLKGVFTLDFKTAWNGIKIFLSGIWIAIKGIFSGVAGFFSSAFSCVKGVVEKAVSGLTGVFSGIWTGIQNVFRNVASFFRTTFKAGWSEITKAFSNPGGFFSGVWSKISGAFGNVKNWFKDRFSGAWTNIKNAFGSVKSFFGDIWSKISGVFSGAGGWFKGKFDAACSAVKRPFSGIAKWFTGVFNGIKTAIKSPLNWIIGAINTVIGGLNKLSFKLPDWAGGKSFGINIPKVPKLAQGGYVKRNTPQLAMIGDNRHQGEVVAPEDKLTELARKGAELAGEGGMTSQVVQLLLKIIAILEELDINIYVDGEKVSKNTVKHINQNTRRTGKCEIVIT